MIQLSQEQRRELTAPEPIAIDPETKQTYVLVRAEVYAKLRPLLEEDVLATADLVDRVMAEDDARDPYLQTYQNITREGHS